MNRTLLLFGISHYVFLLLIFDSWIMTMTSTSIWIWNDDCLLTLKYCCSFACMQIMFWTRSWMLGNCPHRHPLFRARTTLHQMVCAPTSPLVAQFWCIHLPCLRLLNRLNAACMAAGNLDLMLFVCLHAQHSIVNCAWSYLGWLGRCQHSYRPMCMLVTVVIFELLCAELMDMIAFSVLVGMLTVLLSDQITRDPCDMCTLLWFVAFVLPLTNMFITSIYVLLCYVHLNYNCTTSIDDRIESLN